MRAPRELPRENQLTRANGLPSKSPTAMPCGHQAWVQRSRPLQRNDSTTSDPGAFAVWARRPREARTAASPVPNDPEGLKLPLLAVPENVERDRQGDGNGGDATDEHDGLPVRHVECEREQEDSEQEEHE